MQETCVSIWREASDLPLLGNPRDDYVRNYFFCLWLTDDAGLAQFGAVAG